MSPCQCSLSRAIESGKGNIPHSRRFVVERSYVDNYGVNLETADIWGIVDIGDTGARASPMFSS
jgi:repressor of nif and glnA expression